MRKLVLLTVLFMLPAVGFAKAKVFRYSTNAAPTTLDPVQSATKYSNIMVTAIFDSLYEYKYLKRPYELKPSLAESLPTVSKDGLTYTFKIKKGIYFTDDPAFKDGKGREIVAEDVVYSLKRHFDPKTRPQGTWLWQSRIVGLDDWKKQGSDYSKVVEGLKTTDKYTIVVKLTQPYPQFIYTMAMGFSSVVAHEVVKKYGKEITIHPVGSGPWMLKSFNTKKAVLVRNPKYRGDVMDLEGYDPKVHGFTGVEKLKGRKLPIVDVVEVNFMKQVAARWSSFTKGSEIHNASLPTEQLERVVEKLKPLSFRKDYQKYRGVLDPEFGYVYTNFNMEDEEIGYSEDPKQNEANKALRCAIRKAFNWRQRVKRFYNGIGEPFPGIIPPGIDGYDPNLSKDSVEQDVAGAKKLLAAHGWNKKNLPKLVSHGVASVRTRQFFEQFRGWLTKIGYPRKKIKMKSYATFGDYNKVVKNRKAMLIGMGWGLDYPDSENVLQLYYGPNGSPGSNSANYNNPEYDKIFKQASTMQPSPERTKLYQKLNRILIDDCVTIAGFSRTSVLMWHPNVIMFPVESVMGNYFKYVDVL